MSEFRFDVGKQVDKRAVRGKPEWLHVLRVNISRSDAVDSMKQMLSQIDRNESVLEFTWVGELGCADPPPPHSLPETMHCPHGEHALKHLGRGAFGTSCQVCNPDGDLVAVLRNSPEAEAIVALRERFTANEIQTGIVAVAGLERLYAKLEERGGPRDDRLVMAIQNVKAMFQACPEAAPFVPQQRPSEPEAVTDARVVTEEQLEKLGKLVDRIDNLVHAGAIPMPDKLRVTALTEALPDLHSELKALYVEIAGEDPWADPPSSDPPR
jgi:hypothetical protein